MLKKIKNIAISSMLYPIFFILKILKSFVLVRFHNLRIISIGHQVLELMLYSDNKKWNYFSNKKIVDLFFYEINLKNKMLPANKFILALTKRKIPTLYFNWVIKKIYYYLCDTPNFQVHVHPWEFKNVNEKNFFSVRSSPLFLLLPKEVKKGDNYLSKYFQCPPNQEIITFFNRDAFYLKKNFSGETFGHDYRDSSINNFSTAMKFMKDKYFCFRMGGGADEALSYQEERIVNYAQSSHRNDFLDVYLFARSKFFVGDNSGIIQVPCAFRKKMAITNLVPIATVFNDQGFHPGLLNNLMIFKKYYSNDLGRLMRLSEILELSRNPSSSTDFFKGNMIRLIENTSEEIKDLVTEIDRVVCDDWEYDFDHFKRENEFWKIMGAPYKGQYRNLFPKVGYNFLKNNEWLLQ